MRQLYMKVILVLAVVACLGLAGCTTDQRVLTFNAAIAATEVAVTALGQAGELPQATVILIVNAIAPAPAVASAVIQEIDSTDSDVVKAQKITADAAPLLANLKSLPPEAAAISQMVLDAWTAFINSVQPTAMAKGVAKVTSTELNWYTRHKLNGIQTRVNTMAVKIKKLQGR